MALIECLSAKESNVAADALLSLLLLLSSCTNKISAAAAADLCECARASHLSLVRMHAHHICLTTGNAKAQRVQAHALAHMSRALMHLADSLTNLCSRARAQCRLAPLASVQSFKCLAKTLETSLSESAAHNNDDVEASDVVLQTTINNNNNNRRTRSALDHARTQELLDKENYVPQRGQVVSLLLMGKRELIARLSATYLGSLRASLIERVHEFTDCAYTRPERRESILKLLQCIKHQLNRLVKLIYKLQRRLQNIERQQQQQRQQQEHCINDDDFNNKHLIELRRMAVQILEFCFELHYELQSAVIEQSDELDRCNSQLDIVKQLKHTCLLGDTQRTHATSAHFCEQADQLVEVCKMLNQVAPTNKIKITTKSLGLWFETNANELVRCAQSLSEHPHSRAARDCAWTYMQLWCSYYDDFCQLARQLAYLAHALYDGDRATRVLNAREQTLAERHLHHQHHEYADGACGGPAAVAAVVASDVAPDWTIASSSWSLDAGACACAECWRAQSAMHALRPLAPAHQLDRADMHTDSPRSLDHHYGFGAHYAQRADAASYRRPLAAAAPPLPPASPSNAGACCGSVAPPPPVWSVSPRSPSPQFNAQHAAAAAGTQQALPAAAAAYVQSGAHLPAPPAPVPPPARRGVTIAASAPTVMRVPSRNSRRAPPPPLPLSTDYDDNEDEDDYDSDERQGHSEPEEPSAASADEQDNDHDDNRRRRRHRRRAHSNKPASNVAKSSASPSSPQAPPSKGDVAQDQQSSTTEPDKWSDSDADAIVRGARETAQMALSMYQFTRGEGDLNTTQDLFTQAELFAEEANELYKEVRCFSYKVSVHNCVRPNASARHGNLLTTQIRLPIAVIIVCVRVCARPLNPVKLVVRQRQIL